LSTFAVAPNYLTFFNRLTGGPENGYRYLVDSNLDWGQNLWDLRAWMEAHNEEEVAYAHYSPARPATYGIDATLLPPSPRAGEFAPWAPAPGLYAIGATVLQGPYAPDPNTYAWFRAREPEAKLGHALFVYRVAARPPASWAVLCAGTGFGPDRVRGALGQPDLRILQPACTQAYAMPPGAGLVVAPPDLQPPEGVERDFALRAADGSTTAVGYRVEGVPTPSHPVAGVELDGPLVFLGYDLPSERIAPGETLELHTYWRVERVPGRPLSLLAHLVGPTTPPSLPPTQGGSERVTVVGDGLGFPMEQWRPGDVIVQRHALAVPADAPPGAYALHTGGYWLDTMERWPVGADDKLVLATLRIEE
ncbi:MAG: hypothetical protein ACLFTI_04680, partial [Anaerolineales bacterium]